MRLNVLGKEAFTLPPFYDPDIPPEERGGRSGQELLASYLIRLAKAVYAYLFPEGKKREMPPLLPNAGAVERFQRIVWRYGKDVHLPSLNHIPEELRSDPLFQRVVCAITTEPIRDPVVDPTVPAQDIVYEKNALIRWLKSNPTSPYTRLPLSVKKCEFTGDSPLKLQIIYQLHKYQKIISEGLRAGKLQAELSSKEEE